MGFSMCMHDLSESDIDLIGKSFQKVWGSLEQLRDLTSEQ